MFLETILALTTTKLTALFEKQYTGTTQKLPHLHLYVPR